MSESTLAFIAFLKLIFVACGAYLYSLGGTQGFGKWIRRFILPVWMGVGIWIFGQWQGSFQYWHVCYSGLLCGALHLGYGGTDDVFVKLRKRAIYGAALGVSAIPLCISSHLWWLFAIHVGCCVMGSVLLGVYNPSRNARSEETLIAVLSTLFVLFLI